MFSLYSDSRSDYDYSTMQAHSRKASAMLSEQMPTPYSQRRTSVQAQQDFEIQRDDTDGDTLADRFQVLEELGSGSFGVVYKAIEKVSGEIVAIKHVSTYATDTEDKC